MTATSAARAEDLGDELRRLETMIKLFVQLYLAHTPEVPPERDTAAYATIAPRCANYQAAVAEQAAEEDQDGAKATDTEAHLEENRAQAQSPNDPRHQRAGELIVTCARSRRPLAALVC